MNKKHFHCHFTADEQHVYVLLKMVRKMSIKPIADIAIPDDSRWHNNQIRILREILFRITARLSNTMSKLLSASKSQNIYEAVHEIIGHLRLLHTTQDNGSSTECEAASLLLPHLYGTLASTLASCCIALQLPATQFIINLYRLSFTSDRMSTKLKYASMLHCSCQCVAAAEVLTHCEGRLGPDVAHYFVCSGRHWSSKQQINAYLEDGLDGNIADLLK